MQTAWVAGSPSAAQRASSPSRATKRGVSRYRQPSSVSLQNRFGGDGYLGRPHRYGQDDFNHGRDAAPERGGPRRSSRRLSRRRDRVRRGGVPQAGGRGGGVDVKHPRNRRRAVGPRAHEPGRLGGAVGKDAPLDPRSTTVVDGACERLCGLSGNQLSQMAHSQGPLSAWNAIGSFLFAVGRAGGSGMARGRTYSPAPSPSIWL